MQSENLKNFLKLVSDEQPLVHERMKFMDDNEEWLNKALKIVLKVLSVMRERKITQKDLAELLQVTPQRINTILRGDENLTLETIVKLEKALQMEIIEVVQTKVVEVSLLPQGNKMIVIRTTRTTKNKTAIRKQYKKEENPELTFAA
jgi:transcriptional regulator with XRE-family HTH domain